MTILFRGLFQFIYTLPWPVALLLPAVALLLRGADAFLRPRSDRGRRIYGILCLVWLLSVVSCTLLFRGSYAVRDPNTRLFSALDRFEQTRDPETLRSFWMNILLFIPGGMFLTGMMAEDRPGRPFSSAVVRAFRALLVGATLSVMIEFLQIGLHRGTFEADDIAANSFGMFCGTVPELVAAMFRAFLDWKPEGPLMGRLVKLANDKWHIISFLFWGGTTTFVNLLIYYELADFTDSYLLANTPAWILSVIFAFVTNRIYVFRSVSRGFRIVKEGFLFAAGRLFALVLETLLMLFGVEVLHFSSSVVKIAVAIPIAVLNYLIGKIIFRKKTEPEYEDF